jgi:hypothetical protein
VSSHDAGKDKAKAFIEARRLVDGSPRVARELEDAPLSYVVASGEWAAVATADEKIALFRASDGKVREPLPIGAKPVAPRSAETSVIAGENRIGPTTCPRRSGCGTTRTRTTSARRRASR